MRVEALLSFFTTVNEKSFTSAAKKLNLSQPGISMAIKQLEMEFGQRLLDRKPGGSFGLTTIGKEVYQIAKDINIRMESLELIKQRLSKNEIIIECNTLAGFYLISSLTSKFQINNPEISFDIKYSYYPIRSLLERRCDLVFVISSGQGPAKNKADLKVVSWWDDYHEIIVPKHHELAGLHCSISDLTQLLFVLAKKNLPIREILDETMRIQLGSSLNCLVELSNPEALKKSVVYLNKPGIVVRSIIQSELKAGTLCTIKSDIDLHCQHVLAYGKYNTQSIPLSKFIKYVKQNHNNSAPALLKSV